MSTDEYVPSDEQMKADWHAYITTPDEENYYYDALSSEEADARWSRWLAAHDARVRRDAWQEGYDQGAEDGITSEQMQVGIGLGGIARPARTNPYEETP